MAPRTQGVGWPAAPDDRLASAILGGRALAQFENAYAAYAGEAHHMALGFLGDPQLALDAVHNAFLEILRRLLDGAGWSDVDEARAVVLRNTRWAALNLMRTRRRRREAGVAEATTEPEDTADWARAEARHLCDQILLQLRPQHRRALHLHFVDGLSNAEAASHLGVGTSAYESLLRRAIAAARRAARKSGFLPGLAWWPALRPRWPQKPSRLVRVASSSAAMVARAGAVAVLAGVAASAAGLGQEGDHSLLTTAHRTARTSPTSLQRIGADAEQVDDVVISDAIAVDSPATAGTVVAIGRGRTCACWVVARTTDAGGRWTVTAGPDTASPILRLALSSAYPRDARITVVSTGVDKGKWISASYGAPFQSMPAADELHAGAYPHTTRCAATARAPCGGTGAALATANHHLYFPDSGSVLCSADAGRTWRPSCGSP